MNRANQHLLFQTTNQALLGIRQSEINYYQSLNVAFGTQAALIGGFVYSVFTLNQIDYDAYRSIDVVFDVYWVVSAIAIALAVHVILCTMLMQVLGPGLALNGPVGSMAKATEGMRREQKQIIMSFIGMMIFFVLSTVLSFWVVMTLEAALGCTACFAVAARYWYYYCERIYLSFYWEEETTDWNPRDSNFGEEDDEQNPSGAGSNKWANPMHANGKGGGSGGWGKGVDGINRRKGVFGYFHRPNFSGLLRGKRLAGGTAAGTTRGGAGAGAGAVGGMRRSCSRSSSTGSGLGHSGDNKSEESTHGPGTAATSPRTLSTGSGFNLPMLDTGLGGAGTKRDKNVSSDHRAGSPALALQHVNTTSSFASADLSANMTAIGASAGSWVQPKGVVMEGYLTKRGGTITSASLIEFRKEPWERRYFTLTSASNLFIYKNRQEYRTNPKEPMYTRPLRLIEYYIEVNNDDQADRELGDNVSEAQASTVNGSILSKGIYKPFRFQITLILRENVDAVDAATGGGSGGGVGGGGSGAVVIGTNSLSRLEARYRNHWVLRCDTEEELRIWVSAMFELCPSCFQNTDN
jgi:hypothetical protein